MTVRAACEYWLCACILQILFVHAHCTAVSGSFAVPSQSKRDELLSRSSIQCNEASGLEYPRDNANSGILGSQSKSSLPRTQLPPPNPHFIRVTDMEWPSS
ncbi:uncharacterized protein TrAFT101_003876 [Trichoderma asperellum]|uniref:Secreted protein n=1 Tax=Trichoderma asperellum (strain ATCC 204424 / CBS 433.97 / NBRC 101777) TaxID=1042311 RepID=A0A2T3ZPF8_TRIA4|nr:hypothetical protein M441DRAFT_53400 [Trichoderma asperellum CBS 433.97]PTB46678.1 hypothetical protein M441DRAFT_53400 [Trichoderma asperellum CBS 433.97]UKZ88111.1 hypothetical protein TrAFT101_003876 [Trichoderma asperellum]